MQKAKWLGAIGAIVLVLACFSPWASIESRNITISGIHTEGTDFGKPAYFHFLITAFYLLLLPVNKTWSRYLSLFIGATNIAWAFRNFVLITYCQGGECPVKHTAIYLLIPAAIVMLIAVVIMPGKKVPVADTNAEAV